MQSFLTLISPVYETGQSLSLILIFFLLAKKCASIGRRLLTTTNFIRFHRNRQAQYLFYLLYKEDVINSCEYNGYKLR